MKRLSIVLTVLCSYTALLLLTACGGSPEKEMSFSRGRYTAKLNGFLVQEVAVAEPEMTLEEGAEPMEPPVDSMAVEGEGEMAEPMPPANPNVMLDVLIQHDSSTILPGITVDISQVDADRNEKAVWRVWFDTSTVKKANATQYTHVLEDVDYVEGDGFYAEVRHPVPAEERGDYKEFSSAG